MGSTSALNSLLSSASTSSASGVDLSSLLTAATGATSTGIDVTSAVDAAIYAAQAPERQWEAEQTTIQSQITALTSIQTAASALSSDLGNLTDPLGALTTRVVTSSNSSAVSATAASGTAVGTHSISVSQLATAASWYSPVVAGPTASLGSSFLTITKADGTQTSFDLSSSANNTLSSLVQSINAANLGVTASVVQDASGARLALVGTSTGASAAFIVADTTAAASTWTSASLASASSPLSASSFQLSDGTTSADITVSNGTTLSALAAQINASGLNLSASIVGGSTGAHLSISSTYGQQVTVSSDPALTLTQASQAQNASLTVDGVPVSSTTNTVAGALSGISLTLTGTTTNAPAILSVTANTDQINSTVSQFVTDYNSAVTALSSQFTYSASTSSQGVLGSDSVVRSLQSALLGSIGFNVSGGTGSSAISSLAGLGITMQDDGTLTLDSTALSQAISRDPGSVQTFFQGAASNGFANNMQTQLKSFTSAAGGALAIDISNLTQQYNDLQSDVNNYESGYIASQKTLLTSMYSKAEIALQSLPATMKQIQAELNNNSGS
jgi:flagellar hook-associated protein 2